MNENADEQDPAVGEQAHAGPQVSISPEELEDLRKRAEERDQYLDLLKRARADFANYQKRVEENRRRWSLMAEREILARLLSASDQCRLAAAKSADDHSAESLRSALCLVWSEIEKFLFSVGVSPVPAEGAEFDPAKHEAVHVVERDDVPDAVVVQEVIRGYEYKGDILRPAQVVVAKRPSPPAGEASPGASAEGASEPSDRAASPSSPPAEPGTDEGREAEDRNEAAEGGSTDG